MRRFAPTAAAVVAAFAAGFLAGTARPLDPVESVPALSTNEPAPDAQPPETESAPPVLPASPLPTREEPSDPLSAAHDDLAVPPPPSGDEEIVVVTRTLAGEQLEDVLVTLWPGLPDEVEEVMYSENPAARDQDLARATLQHLRWRTEGGVTGRTDASGEIRFSGLADHWYIVIAEHPDYALRPANRHNIARPGTFRMIATPQVAVDVEIVMADGRVPDRARLTFAQERRSRGEEWSPDAPTVHVLAGSYTVSVVAGRWRQYRADEQGITLVHRERAALRFVVGGRPGLHFTLSRDDPWGFPELVVYALSASGDGAVTPERLRDEGRAVTLSSRGRGDDDTLDDIRPGTWVIGVAATQGSPVAVLGQVTVEDELVEYEVRPPRLLRSEFVVVRCVDGRGRSLLGTAKMQVGRQGKWSRGSGTRPGATIAAHGPDAIRVRHDEGWYRGEDGPYFVEMTVPGYGTRRVEYDRSEAPEVTVRLDGAATLLVTLAGYESSVLRGDVVARLWPVGSGDPGGFHSGGTGNGWERPSSAGEVRFTGVQPGEHWLLLHHHDSTRAQRDGPISRERITLASGHNASTVPLPTLHTVRFENVANGHLIIRRVGFRNWQTWVSAPDGVGEWRGVAPGTYTLQHGNDVREIEVPRTTLVSY